MQLNPANRWIHPTLDFDANWSAFVADSDAQFPFVYISFPSVQDPSFASRYPGRHTIEVIAPAPYEQFAEWEQTGWKRRGEDYES